MELKEIMQFKNFVVLGNTIKEDRYAYKIKHELIKHGYNVASVSKELSSINDVDFEIECLDICINPEVAIKYLNENKKDIKSCIIQPGAESDSLISLLNEKNIPYILGCALVGMSLYKK